MLHPREVCDNCDVDDVGGYDDDDYDDDADGSFD